MSSSDSFLVIGGCGFLGRHIVEALIARGELQVAVFDLVQRHYDTNIQFFTGDIADENAVVNAIRKSGATTIFHTASPIHGLPQNVYHKVNVDGTRTVIAAAIANGVQKLIYTSSASLVFDHTDLIDIDERLLPPEKPMDAYSGTKAIAERLVIEANGKEQLRTVSLRPSGIFGPGDRQMINQIARAVRDGQTKVQIGSNDNLTDWTYVDNVVKAHLLAADRLLEPPLPPVVLADSLPTVALTSGERRMPTSRARPIGPAIEPPPNAEELTGAYAGPRSAENRAFVRGKFDPLSEAALQRYPNATQVAGQIFIITNAEPVYAWDFMRSVMRGLGAPDEDVARAKWVLPHGLGYWLAWAAEWAAWFTRRDIVFTRLRVEYMSMARYYNCEKARRVLGYEPDIGMQEGIRRTTEWWNSTQKGVSEK